MTSPHIGCCIKTLFDQIISRVVQMNRLDKSCRYAKFELHLSDYMPTYIVFKTVTKLLFVLYIFTELVQRIF